MKLMRVKPWVIVPALLVASAFSFIGRTDGVTLRRTLIEGDAETYHISHKSKLNVESAMGDQDIESTGSMDSTQTIGKVDATGQSAAVTVKETNIQIETNSPMPIGELPKELTTTGVIDVRNRISNLKFDSAAVKLMSRSFSSAGEGGSGVEFPDGPVNIGDTWITNLPDTPVTKSAQLNAKFMGDRMVDRVNCWVIAMSGRINVDADIAKMMEEGAGAVGSSMPMKGTVDVDSEVLLDKTTCLLRSSTSKLKPVINVDVMGQDVSIKGTTDVTIVRTK